MLDLNVIKKQLETQKEELEQRLGALTKDLHHRDEAMSADFAEQSTEMENYEVLVALDKEGRHELEQIESALRRIDDKRYGQCTQCRGNIGEKRLQAIPHAALCMDCSSQQANKV
jgi:DnaK suppressor protein